MNRKPRKPTPLRTEGYDINPIWLARGAAIFVVALLAFFAKDIYAGIKSKPDAMKVALEAQITHVETGLSARIAQIETEVDDTRDNYHRTDREIGEIKKDQEHIKQGVQDIKRILEQQQYPPPGYAPPTVPR